MAVQIKHPKNKPVPRKSFVANGKCTNSANVSGYLKQPGKPNIRGVLISRNKKHWGLIFKNVGDGDYTLHVDEAAGVDAKSGCATAASSDEVDFSVRASPGPSPAPDITYPGNMENVNYTFYPYGTSGAEIDLSSIKFYDATNRKDGSLLQQIDAQGFWYGVVEDLDLSGFPSGGSYSLDVSNGSVATRTNITITP
jgi:hypothetical protein